MSRRLFKNHKQIFSDVCRWFHAIKSFFLESSYQRSRIGLFILTYLAYSTLYSARKPLSVVKTVIQNELNITTYDLGNIDTAFLTTYALGQVLLVPYAEKIGIRYSLTIAYLGSGLACLIFGLCKKAPIMILSWFINGLFHSISFPLLVKLVTPWFLSHERIVALCIWASSQQTGSILSTWFTANIASSFGWRHAFFIPSLVVTFFSILIFFLLDDTTPNLLNPKNKTSKIDIQDNEDNISIAVDNKLPDTSVRSHDLSDVEPLSHKKQQSNCITSTNCSQQVSYGPNEKDSSELILSSPIKLIEVTSKTYGHISHDLDIKKTIDNQTKNDDLDKKIKILKYINPNSYFYNLIIMLHTVPHLIKVSISYFFLKLIRYALLFWLPFYLSTQLKFSTKNSALYSLFFDAGGIVGSVTIGYISSTLFRGKTFLCISLLSLLVSICIFCFTLLTTSTTSYQLISLIILSGYFISAVDSIIGTVVPICLHEYVNRNILSNISGFINGVGSFGSVFQGIIISLVSVYYGWNYLYFILCFFALFAAFILYFVYNNLGSKNNANYIYTKIEENV